MRVELDVEEGLYILVGQVGGYAGSHRGWTEMMNLKAVSFLRDHRDYLISSQCRDSTQDELPGSRRPNTPAEPMSDCAHDGSKACGLSMVCSSSGMRSLLV